MIFRRFTQYYTTFCVNLLSIGYGTIVGWASPVLPVLQSDKTPLACGKLTDDNVAWLTSVVCIGGILGCIITAIVADRYGRKVAAYLTAIPCLLNWVLLIFASSFLELVISRFVAGLVGGGTYLVIPLYVTEISENSVRGTLGSIIQVVTILGIVLGYTLGGYLDYYLISYIFLIFPGLFFIGFWFVPETPAFLISQHKIEEAEKSLMFFRGYKSDSDKFSIAFLDELKTLKANAGMNSKKNKLCLNDFTKRSSRYAILLNVSLFIVFQANGGFVMINYISTIFSEAGTNISNNIASIIIGLVFLAGTYSAMILVDRAGRRPLMIGSSMISGTCLLIAALFFYLKSLEFDMAAYSWVLIASIAGYYYTSALGIVALPFIIAGEMLPIEIRGIISMFLRVLLSVVGFIFLKYFYAMIEALQLYGLMLFFTCTSYLIGIITYIWLPETKGKPIVEIIALLEHRNK